MSRSWLAGLEERAARALPAAVAEYVGCGAGEGVTRAEAPGSWQEVRLLPRVLRDVSSVDLSVRILGRTSPVPWGLAPTSLQRAIHPDGELASATATAALGALMVVSSNAGTPFSAIGATGVRWWLQTYLPRDRDLARPLLARAVRAGAEAIVLTVDTPVVGTKHSPPPVIWDVVDPDTVRVNFDPGYDNAPGSEKALDLQPRDIAWLGEVTGLPVVVKGVLRADDAVRCREAGAGAVWVSNHGGRQLDRAVSTACALPGVRAGTGDDFDVYVDGGLRSGLDVLTGLALGANAVFMGRLASWALVDGAAGVARMHAELGAEALEVFRLSGCATVPEARGIVCSSPTAGP